MNTLNLNTALAANVLLNVAFVRSNGNNPDCEAQQIDLIRTKVVELGLPPDEVGIVTDTDALKALMHARLLKLVVVSEVNRLGRSDRTLNLIWDFVSYGVRFVSIRDSIDTVHEGWEARVHLASIATASRSRYTSERVREGQKRRLAQPNACLGVVPFGFKAVVDPTDSTYGKARKRLVIDEVAAAIVRSIFGQQDLIPAPACDAIAAGLNRDNVPIPGGAAAWTARLVKKVLTDERYIGDWTWGKTRVGRTPTGRKITVKAPPEDVIRVVHPDLQIVDEALFARVQARFHSNKAA